MLIGQYDAVLTDKGRLALPKKFRDSLGVRVIVAKWYEGCLVVVPSDSLNELLGRLTAESKYITGPVRDTDRFVLGSAFEVDLDKQGRFVVPKYLKDFATLSKDVIFLGLGGRVEIWDKKVWTEREAYIQKNAEDLVETIARESKDVKRIS
jgi:MraZ protein